MRNLRFALFFLTLMLTVTAIVAAQETPAPETPEAPAVTAQESPTPEAPAPKESDRLILSDPDTEGTLVVTGKAVNASPDEIIIETEDGQKVFVVDAESLYPEPIAEGQTVTVWYVERANQLYATALEAGDHLNPETLPKTASRQPLFLIASLVALAGALILWRVRKTSDEY